MSVWVIVAVALSATGVGALFSSWRQWVRPRGGVVTAGWLSLVASTLCWSRGLGVEFGVSYALLLVPALAWLAVVVNRQVKFARPRNAKPRRQQAAGAQRPATHSIVQHLLLFAAVIPLAGAASLLVSAALPQLIPWQEVDRLVAPVFLLPLIWGGAACWVCAAARPLRATLVITASGAVAGGYLFL